MELNKLFDMIEKTRESTNWRAAFGEPQVVDDKTIIPVAQVTYGFGLGYGVDEEPDEMDPSLLEDETLVTAETEPRDVGGGGGGGGGAQVRPLGAIIVTPESVYVEEAVDSTKVALAGVLMSAWAIYQVAKTVRTVFGRK